MKKIIIDGNSLTLDDLVNVARYNFPVEISEEALAKVKVSRQIVDDIVEAGQISYGITTGFGKFSDVAISKDEAGQMNNHCGWFESEYGKGHNVKRILIIPTNVLATNADFTHEIHVMNAECLTQFKNNFSKFIHEFKGYDLNDMTTDKIHSFLIANKLTIEDLKKYYAVHVIREK